MTLKDISNISDSSDTNEFIVLLRWVSFVE